MFLKIRAGWNKCAEALRNHFKTQRENRALVHSLIQRDNKRLKVKVVDWRKGNESYLVACARVKVTLFTAKHYLYVIDIRSRGSIADREQLSASVENLKVEETGTDLRIAVWHSYNSASHWFFDKGSETLSNTPAAA